MGIETLYDTSDQVGVTDTCGTLYIKATEYTFFSNAYGTFSKIDHIIGKKRSLNKYMKNETVSSICLDHNGMKLDNNCMEKTNT